MATIEPLESIFKVMLSVHMLIQNLTVLTMLSLTTGISKDILILSCHTSS